MPETVSLFWSGVIDMNDSRLPWSKREGLLYGSIIALITAFIMATFNIAQTHGRLDADVLYMSLTTLPVIWAAVMILMVSVVERVSDEGVRRFTDPTDGFNTRIVFKIIFCVTMMSAIMSFLGPFIGEVLSGNITWACADEWIARWPTNFFVAFWVEMLIAQPVARSVMKRMHACGSGVGVHAG